ncbi:uncharacterized protein N7518_005094 [Penicillium psychrosexuale]|uniref:uncharacterized protein n=1 Tax=Penicillium psychrosexuale TaxID=1002107 RepID=UPI00254540E0|nr:uncharacterized protein N7518_005094 [Penicillium psychrosexuale]KAJ5796554.1 hypothetical protein N7518_005094 [Penicillium psychrosexuale]
MPVGPRVSKEEFMLALGLNPQDPHHEQYYRAMRDEAIIVYNRMNLDTSNLLDNRWAILEICHNAPPLVRGLFERGATTGEYGPNWVAGWLLYSVFRSRDVRNNRNRRKGEVGGSAGLESDKRTRQEEPKKYYDPVRNGTL